jgi:hypothetical protein
MSVCRINSQLRLDPEYNATPKKHPATIGQKIGREICSILESFNCFHRECDFMSLDVGFD